MPPRFCQIFALPSCLHLDILSLCILRSGPTMASSASSIVVPYFSDTCHPNPFFRPGDVTFLASGNAVIDLTRGSSPTPSSRAHSEESEQDERPYVVVAPPDHLERGLSHVLSCVLKINNSEALVTVLGYMLSGMRPDGSFADYRNLWMRRDDGMDQLWPYFHTHLIRRIVNCAGLILTALNDYIADERGFTPQTIPFTCPITALTESVIPFPVIVGCATGAGSEPMEYRTQEGIEGHITDILETYRYGLATYCKIAAVARRLGMKSVCNPGAGLGIAKADYLSRLGPIDEEFDRREAWIDRIRVVFNSDYRQRADNACARLITPQVVSTFITYSYSYLFHTLPSLTLVRYLDSRTLP
ncbi:hypothetical protein MSAN_01320200 [Mycena sanguinolenta]|uniref:Uncharacterized protein n=1 Tax=Mycena sanguinolenta TaxID=230812 RepID=A0A8H7D0Q1_9AGAR|nr:hypothetical protein MSAN_01320200 [Mycena sanguinolenta]